MAKLLLLLMFFLFGCVTMTPEEQEYRRGVDKINWNLCMGQLARSGIITYHRDHQHGRKHPTSRADAFDIRWDLGDNNCKLVLREHFAGY